MKVLVTGFDPFGGESRNPSYEAVKLLPDRIAGATIVKAEIPTEFEKSSVILKRLLEEMKPDIVICVGQAGGRSAISFERVAINLAEARIPDNKGNQPVGAKLELDGETAYFTNLPIKAMRKNVVAHELPADISYTAGTFVCNAVMYRLLYLIDREYPDVRGGFIHVPFEPGQVLDRAPGTACLPLQTICDGLYYAIEACVTNPFDREENAGTLQ
ncbi:MULTISPECIES: pyroglutamyl-peptidase I [unclassified Enterococcus]|uniref:pyroglutamyl-peptidase I n=1 Tax=unclassified Enterococcus TaxID=2608891 RepID=UPI001CE150E3|nr:MULTISPECIES: pyroglutamyl-peptidase I [unclassified Enterococcus]MCA5013006.1 pyroglutamyl-peptidase I [Enterococcus sp. S23]MCA5016257.1 pyroglutamyl-peptidase I [Enterococcus sp. S22(2020)]